MLDVNMEKYSCSSTMEGMLTGIAPCFCPRADKGEALMKDPSHIFVK